MFLGWIMPSSFSTSIQTILRWKIRYKYMLPRPTKRRQICWYNYGGMFPTTFCFNLLTLHIRLQCFWNLSITILKSPAHSRTQPNIHRRMIAGKGYSLIGWMNQWHLRLPYIYIYMSFFHTNKQTLVAHNCLSRNDCGNPPPQNIWSLFPSLV